MPRFELQLWDRQGFLHQKTLVDAYQIMVHNELNEEHSLEFRHPIKHPDYGWVSHRKLIRLADTTIQQPISTISVVTIADKELTLADASDLRLNDYIQIFEDGFTIHTFTTTAITAGEDATFDVDSTAGLTIGGFFALQGKMDKEKASETIEILNIAGSTITADVANTYSSGASVYSSGRAIVARVNIINGNVIRLSRLDFAPSTTGGYIRKINFTTFRIVHLMESREAGVPVAAIRCNNLRFDLNDTLFFNDSRTDVSYASKGPNQIIQDRVGQDEFIDNVLDRHKDSSSLPARVSDFIKGDLYRFYYSRGTVETFGTTTVTGDFLAGFNSSDLNISGHSTIAIEGETTLFTITQQTGSNLIITPTATTTASGLRYFIVGRGIHITNEKVGTCTVAVGTEVLTTFSFSITGGDISHGARVKLEGDTKVYIVDYVTSVPSIFLTEDVVDADGAGQTCVIERDEREISLDANVTLLGALKSMINAFNSDEREQFWLEIGEDRSINIHQKPIPDSMDPISELVIENTGENKNIKSISKESDIEMFGNHLIPLGSSSNWSNAQSGITTTVASSGDNKEDRYLLANNHEFNVGDPCQIYSSDQTGTVDSATQVVITDTSQTFDDNEFVGGLLLITSGNARGQIRRVVSNQDTTITVSRRWDILPTGSTYVVAHDIGNTFIRGYGYKKGIVKAVVGTDRVRIDNYAPADFVYRGGLLTVSDGTGVGQFFRIRRSATVAGNSFFDIVGDFDPVTVVDSSEIEVFMMRQVVEEARSGTVFNSAPNYAEFTPDADHGAGEADMFNGGRLYITSGSNVDNYTITDTTINGADIRVHVSAWTSGAPTNGDAILVINEHLLLADFTTGLKFTASAGDTISLLLKESGGPLTIGKDVTQRSTVDENQDITFTSFNVKAGDGSKFEEGELIFIGTADIDSLIFYDLNRGSQIQGMVATVASVSTDTITTVETLNPVPQPGDHVEVLSLVDRDSIIKNGIVEVGVNFSDINNPRILTDKARFDLDERKEIKPRYEVGFVSLFDLDPDRFPFDSFQIGDTVRVIDDELGIDVSDIQILRHEFDASRPADVTNTIEVGRKPRKFMRDTIENINLQLKSLDQRLDKVEQKADVGTCVYWNAQIKKCVRIDAPNYFCDSQESARNGKHAKEGHQITNLHCQAYRPNTEEQIMNDEGSIVETVISDVTVTSESFTTLGIDVDFHVQSAVTTCVDASTSITRTTSSDGAHDHAGAVDSDGAHTHTVSFATDIGIDLAEIAVQLRTFGSSIPEPSNPNNQGRGCNIEHRKTSATYSSINARLMTVCTGYRI